MKPARPFLALAVTALVAACASAPPAKTGEDTAAPPPDAMSKAELCDHIGQRICKRCVPEGVEECTTGYQQTCGDDAKTTQVSPSKEELAACDKGVDTAACASLIGGELPSACTSGSDW
jgi:hypothetical protein